MRSDKIKHTAAHREHGDSQPSGTETPERHCFGVKGYETIIGRAVGSHECEPFLFRSGRKVDVVRDAVIILPGARSIPLALSDNFSLPLPPLNSRLDSNLAREDRNTEH